MKNTRVESPAVLYSTERVPTVSLQDAQELMDALREHPERASMRLCTHRDIAAPLHQMFIVQPRGAYIRPHRHRDRDITVTLFSGAMTLVTFSPLGEVDEVIFMGDYASGRPFFCHIPEGLFYTQVIESEQTFFNESLLGPFRAADVVYADFAPPVGSRAAATWLAELTAKAQREREREREKSAAATEETVKEFLMHNRRAESPSVIYSTEHIPKVSLEDARQLADALREHPERASMRLCTHRDIEAPLHQMFIVHPRGVYIRPHRHNRDMAVTLFSGAMTLVTFSPRGEVDELIFMRDHASGRPSFCHIPDGLFYTKIIESEQAFFNESLPGPFQATNTVDADFAPPVGSEAAAGWLADLTARARNEREKRKREKA